MWRDSIWQFRSVLLLFVVTSDNIPSSGSHLFCCCSCQHLTRFHQVVQICPVDAQDITRPNLPTLRRLLCAVSFRVLTLDWRTDLQVFKTDTNIFKKRASDGRQYVILLTGMAGESYNDNVENQHTAKGHIEYLRYNNYLPHEITNGKGHEIRDLKTCR
jgi:hypothetical protein